MGWTSSSGALQDARVHARPAWALLLRLQLQIIIISRYYGADLAPSQASGATPTPSVRRGTRRERQRHPISSRSPIPNPRRLDRTDSSIPFVFSANSMGRAFCCRPFTSVSWHTCARAPELTFSNINSERCYAWNGIIGLDKVGQLC